VRGAPPDSTPVAAYAAALVGRPYAGRMAEPVYRTNWATVDGALGPRITRGLRLAPLQAALDLTGYEHCGRMVALRIKWPHVFTERTWAGSMRVIVKGRLRPSRPGRRMGLDDQPRFLGRRGARACVGGISFFAHGFSWVAVGIECGTLQASGSRVGEPWFYQRLGILPACCFFRFCGRA
jgi:hypothetical protein